MLWLTLLFALRGSASLALTCATVVNVPPDVGRTSMVTPAVVCGTRYFLDVKPEQVDMIIDELERNPRPEGEVV